MADYTDNIKAHIEKMYNLVLSTTAVTEYIDGGHEYLITKYPITTVTAIYNVYGSTTVTATAYDHYDNTGTIYYVEGGCWDDSRREQWKVTYTTGLGTTPDDISLAITLWNAYLNDNPSAASELEIGDYRIKYGTTSEFMPANVKQLLQKYMRRRI